MKVIHVFKLKMHFICQIDQSCVINIHLTRNCDYDIDELNLIFRQLFLTVITSIDTFWPCMHKKI